jgi:hypothetical protein
MYYAVGKIFTQAVTGDAVICIHSLISMKRFLIPSAPISSPKIPQLEFSLTNTALGFRSMAIMASRQEA